MTEPIKKQAPKQLSPELDPINDNGFFDDGIDIPIPPSAVDEVVLNASGPEDAFDYDVAFKVAFVGVGQAGCRIARTFYDIGYRRVVVIDGPIQDLADVSNSHPDIPQLSLGTGGSGKDLSKGEAAIAAKREEIWDLLVRGVGTDVDYILVCCSLGGGTGAGGSHLVFEIAKQYMEKIGKDPRVGCMVALPHPGEGQRVARNALHTFSKLSALDPAPMVIIDNKRIQELFRIGIAQVYNKCNEQTAQLFHLFNQLAAQRSQLITFDRAELGSLLDKGIIVYGASAITSFNSSADVAGAVREQLGKTALAEVDLNSGREAGCIFVGGQETLDAVPMDFLDGGFDMLERILQKGSLVHRGVYKGSKPGLRCFTLLAGLDPPKKRLAELQNKSGLSATAFDIAKHFGIDE